MRQVKLAVAVFATYLIVVVGISTLSPSKARSQNVNNPISVKVANTPLPVSVPNPLPVTGSVNAAVTGSVAVSNTPSVTIANTPLSVAGNVNATVSGAVNATVAGTVNAAQSGGWSVDIGKLPAVQLAVGSRIGQDGDWTVAISGTPNVTANQGGQWSVGINNTPTVQTGLEGRLDTANDHLQAVQTATSGLSYDGSNNLKVAPQGTQNVNIVGGNLSASNPPAGKAFSFRDTIGHAYVVPGYKDYPVDFPTINTTTLILWCERPLNIYVSDTIGGNMERFIGVIGGGESKVFTFTQPVPLNHIKFINYDLLANTQFSFVAYGN